MLGASGIKLETFSLSELSSFFGISRREKYDALEDVHISARILKHLYDLIIGVEMV